MHNPRPCQLNNLSKREGMAWRTWKAWAGCTEAWRACGQASVGSRRADRPIGGLGGGRRKPVAGCLFFAA